MIQKSILACLAFTIPVLVLTQISIGQTRDLEFAPRSPQEAIAIYAEAGKDIFRPKTVDEGIAKYRAAKDYFERKLESFEGLSASAGLQILLIRTTLNSNLAQAEHQRDNHQESLALLAEAKTNFPDLLKGFKDAPNLVRRVQLLQLSCLILESQVQTHLESFGKAKGSAELAKTLGYEFLNSDVSEKEKGLAIDALTIAHEQLAQILAETGDIDLSIEQIEKALELADSDFERIECLYTQANIYLQAQRVTDCTKVLKRADSLSSGSELVTFGDAAQLDTRIRLDTQLGNAEEAIGNVKRLVEFFAPVEKTSPNAAVASSRLGSLWLDVGETDAAVQSYRKALNISVSQAADNASDASLSSNLRHSLNLATALEQVGQLEEAEVLIRRVLQTVKAAKLAKSEEVDGSTWNLDLDELDSMTRLASILISRVAAEPDTDHGKTISEAKSYLESVETGCKVAFPIENFPNGHRLVVQNFRYQARIAEIDGNTESVLGLLKGAIVNRIAIWRDVIRQAKPLDAVKLSKDIRNFLEAALKITKGNEEKNLEVYGLCYLVRAALFNAQCLDRRIVAPTEALNLIDSVKQEIADLKSLRRSLAGTDIFVDVVEHNGEYTAFVLEREKPVLRIELGSATTIDKKVTKWLAGLKRPRISKETNEDVFNSVWKPIAKNVKLGEGKPRRVFLATDGELSRLPWAAIKDEKGDYLLNHCDFVSVPSGRFLSNILTEPAVSRKENKSLVVTDVDFGFGKAMENFIPKTKSWPQLDKSNLLQNLSGSPLKDEMQSITGDKAQRNSIFQETQISKPRWIFYNVHAYLDAKKNENYPLKDCGLVLAKANEIGLDGTISAYEIASAQLNPADAAFLLACGTANGRSVSGEGVFNLQRAFHLNGTRAVLCSLWEVDETQTDEMMRLLIEEFFENGESLSNALRRAQLKLIDDGFAPHPRYWSAWILSGDGKLTYRLEK